MNDTEDSNYQEVLQRVFGFSSLRGGQQQVVEALLQGRSSVAIFPTGAGKSLCYQLPALMWPGMTLVVSPLMALMREQVDVLRSRGVAAERLDSSLEKEEVVEVFRKVRAGEVKLLYVAPERFANERFRSALAGCELELLAVDEAHCISEWGHNFRPDYLKLAAAKEAYRIKRCLALTATATPSVAQDIQHSFGVRDGDVVKTGFRRENLALHVTSCRSDERDRLLVDKVMATDGPAIVYVTLQFTAESVAGLLQRAGVSARAYHGGMRSEARGEIQEAFQSDKIRVVVATIAFGMGIDKGGIRAVFHYNLPKTLENYSQEIGRAGRDGQRSHCEVLACLEDLIPLENFVFGDTPDPAALKSVLEHVLLVGQDFDLSLYNLSRSCDVKPVVLETILAHLELGGWIEPLGAFYAERSIRFVRSEQETLKGHSSDRQQFLAGLFATGRSYRGWLAIPLIEASAELEEPVAKISEALDWLESHGDIFQKPSKVRKRYRRLRDADPPTVRLLAEKVSKNFKEREGRDIGRLDEVVSFMKESSCLVLRLMAYFGEQDERECGCCSSCLSSRSLDFPEREAPELTIEDLQLIQTISAERQAALRTPRQLARFFCGISSPASAGARLKRHRAYGIFAQYPFEDVLIAVSALGKTRI